MATCCTSSASATASVRASRSRRTVLVVRVSTVIVPTTAFITSLRHAAVCQSVVVSTSRKVSVNRWAVRRPGSSSGTTRCRRNPTRTWPGASRSAGMLTTAGTSDAGPMSGSTRSRWVMPFWRTTTSVSGPHAAASHGATSGVWWALVPSRTRWNGPVTAKGSVSTGTSHSIRSSSSSTAIVSNGVRAATASAISGRCRTAPATVSPIAPGPMSSTRVIRRRPAPSN